MFSQPFLSDLDSWFEKEKRKWTSLKKSNFGGEGAKQVFENLELEYDDMQNKFASGETIKCLTAPLKSNIHHFLKRQERQGSTEAGTFKGLLPLIPVCSPSGRPKSIRGKELKEVNKLLVVMR